MYNSDSLNGDYLMADITMCEGTNCPMRANCYRYTAPVNPYRQSYFRVVPVDGENCNYYSPVILPVAEAA